MTMWQTVIGHVRWAQAQRLVLVLTATMVVLIQAAVLFQAMSRGLDYVGLPSDRPTIQALTVVERIVPIKLSGWVFFIAAILGYLGMAIRQVPLAALAHFVLAVAYGLFAFGSFAEILTREGELTGWRTATSWVTAAVIHGVFAVASEYAWRVNRAG